MIAYDQEALRRMDRRNSDRVTWTLKDITVEYAKIPASQARNWDGTPAGTSGDPNKVIIQKKTVIFGRDPRYTNWW